MKKRLSSERWYARCVPIALTLDLALAFVAYRATSMPMDYDIVRGDIPLLAVPLEDLTMHRYSEQPTQTIDQTTTTVVMDDDGNLFFGDLAAFTTRYQDVRNKFAVQGVDGAPQLGTLMNQLRLWLEKKPTNRKSKGIAILVPAGKIPMTIVIKTMSELRYSDIFDRVVLANGFM